MFNSTAITNDYCRALPSKCDPVNRNLLPVAQVQGLLTLLRRAALGLTLMTSTALYAAPQPMPASKTLAPTQCEVNKPALDSAQLQAARISPLDLEQKQELTIEEESYADALSAVIAASNYFNPLSIQEDREYIGAILKHKHQGHFIYTVSSGQSGEDTVSARIKIPAEYEITAFWHTHGNHHWTRKYFSDVDTQLAKQWGLPFYMAEASGKLRVYNPQDPTLSSMRSRKMGLGAQSGYAKGRIVSHHQERVDLATNMTQWLALHQAPAVDQNSAVPYLNTGLAQSCDSVAAHIDEKQAPQLAKPNQS